MLRTRECHVQETQVFSQAVGVGQRQLRVAVLEQQLARTVGVLHIHKAGALALFGAKAGGKGQTHHRVLQALALVNGDDFDQVSVALQTQHMGIALTAAALALREQPAHQCMLAVQVHAGGLQEFGQMQKVGQPPLTVGCWTPARRQLQLVQCLAQHGQHALGAPNRAQLAQLFAALVKGFIVMRQPSQRVQAQPQGGGGQSGTHQAHVLRVGHGAQPVHQVGRLLAFKHRVAVGQIDRGQAPALQGLAYGAGLATRAHQNRNVGGAQALKTGVCVGTNTDKTRVRSVKPGHDLCCAQF